MKVFGIKQYENRNVKEHMEAELIWKNFDQALSRFICGKVKHQDICHDILQNVYIKVIDNSERIQRAENLGAYLFRIANNEVYNYYRSISKNEEIGVEEDRIDEREKSTPEFELADCCLRPMIEALPPIYRDALILTELEGLSQVALAEKFKISVSGAKSRVQRAREKLKAEILKCCRYEFDKYGNIISKTKNKKKS